jgi:hypothetical protein
LDPLLDTAFEAVLATAVTGGGTTTGAGKDGLAGRVGRVLFLTFLGFFVIFAFLFWVE